eukprot:CAMPEP_0117440112 /NCGR_PEP_ID=MMETSP0759-20121206/2911_1 /TAXON_ID=63605 /ORGANISM="Percolomonas cosmopolitus, Strain WS" /LENGTH=439 /DNA_ID=CAMNT_0005231845 /DNA_START=865 /DNA_END=2184 /DNA_ORIENTATION=+
MIACAWRPSLRILLVDFWSIVLFDLETGQEKVLFTKKSSRLFNKPQKLVCCSKVYEGDRVKKTLLCFMNRRDHTVHGKQIIIGLPLPSSDRPYHPSATSTHGISPSGRHTSHQSLNIQADRVRTTTSVASHSPPTSHTTSRSVTPQKASSSADTFVISCKDMCTHSIMDENTLLIASHSALYLYDSINGKLLTECQFTTNSKAGAFAPDDSLIIAREDCLIAVVSARKIIILQFIPARSGTGNAISCRFKVILTFSKLHINILCPVYIFNRELYASQITEDSMSFLKVNLLKKTSVTALKKSRHEYKMTDLKISPVMNSILILWSDVKGTKVLLDCVRGNRQMWSKSITLPWRQTSHRAGTHLTPVAGNLNNLQVLSDVVSVCLRSSLDHTTAYTYLLSIETGHKLHMEQNAESGGGRRFERGMPNWWTLHKEEFVEFQ